MPNIAKSNAASFSKDGTSRLLGATPIIGSMLNGGVKAKVRSRSDVGVNSAATVSTMP